MNSISTDPLSRHSQLLPTVCSWLESEWPGYYGPGGKGRAQDDVATYFNSNGKAPFGLLAFVNGAACGFMALKTEVFPSHPQLGPWVGAAYVQPHLRRHGVGAALIKQLAADARHMGYERIHCATSTADTLLLRCGWSVLDAVEHDGHVVRVYVNTP